MLHRNFIAATAVAVALAFTCGGAASAQQPVIIQNTAPPPPAPVPVVVANPRPVTTETTPSGYAGPNRAMLATGLVTFGLSYGTAIVIAAESDHFGDSHLYIPVAGPWIDLADRGPCGLGTGVSCDNETANKVGLAIDGGFQALGALLFLGSFIFPEQHTTVTVTAKSAPPKPEVHFAPTTGRSGTGLAVFGSF
jgi:hypothetical protein